MGEKRYKLRVLYRAVGRAVRQGVSSPADEARIASVIMDGLGVSTADEAWDRLVGDFRAGRRGTRRSALRAARVLRMYPYLAYAGLLSDEAARVELLREALDHGPDDPAYRAWVVLLSAARGMRIETGDPAALEAELALLDRVRESIPTDSEHRQNVDLAAAFIRGQLAALGGSDEYDAVQEELAMLQDRVAGDPWRRDVLNGVLAMRELATAFRRSDEAALGRQWAALGAVLEREPPAPVLVLRFEAAREWAWYARQMLRDEQGVPLLPGGDHPTRTAASVRRLAQDLPPYTRSAVLCETGAARFMRALVADDPACALEAVSLLGEGVGSVARDDSRWVSFAFQLALAQRHVAEQNITSGVPRPGHGDEAIALLTRTVDTSGGPAHPMWSEVCFALADALRARGNAASPGGSARSDFEEARRLGLEAVDGILRNVLLQSGTDHAAQSAQLVGPQALDVAGWCLADGAHDEAVRSLDAGRGLTLHAATVRTSVPAMLDTLGMADLANAWRRAEPSVPPPPGRSALAAAAAGPSGPPSRLRRRVLEVLDGSPYRERLLDVPSPHRMGGALRAMGRTALVYLLPGGQGRPGTALVVTADGRVQPVPLPALYAAAPRFEAYRDAARIAGGPPTNGSQVPGPAASGRYRQELDRLCGWAGSEVMAPLLDAVTRPGEREPSLVLVPMGELGAVPWHAARLPSGRYVCQEAEISYTPSARLLCEVAGRRSTGVRRAVVVGDPTGNLYHAGVEARAIHGEFYPEGTLLGTATATPANVAARVARQGGGVLHLACHGNVAQGGRHSSYLELSGGHLPAEELTEGASRFRDLDLVVLAACRSNVSGHGWDEAYSLSTAFLVAGARSVVGSLWPVPDDATSLLMYMTHHYLNAEGLTPGSALRRAQLWMLDAGRQAPPGMPADMGARVGRIDGSDLVGWAGFTHLGW